jgi:hypothetical protein
MTAISISAWQRISDHAKVILFEYAWYAIMRAGRQPYYGKTKAEL